MKLSQINLLMDAVMKVTHIHVAGQSVFRHRCLSIDRYYLSHTQEAGGVSKTRGRRRNAPPTPSASMTRQRLTSDTPSSPAARRTLRYSNSENNENAPPRVLRDNNPHNAEEPATPRGKGHLTQGVSPSKRNLNTSQSKESPGGAHERSNLVDLRKMQNLFKTAAEDNIKSIRTYVTDLKERVAKLQYQKQLLVCQVNAPLLSVLL